MGRIVVLGMGNTVMRDDGVGIQFASVASGIGLTPPVVTAIDPAAHAVIDLVAR